MNQDYDCNLCKLDTIIAQIVNSWFGLSRSGIMDPRSLDFLRDVASNHDHTLRTVMARHENIHEMASNCNHMLKTRLKL